MTSRCCSRFSSAAALLLLAVPTIAPQGAFGRAPEVQPVEKSFDPSRAPVLLARRVERRKLQSTQSCGDVERAFFGSRHGKGPGIETLETQWGEWNAADREFVVDCDEFPCGVKLNAEEAAALAAAPEAERLKTFVSQVTRRVERYLKLQKPLDYEFASTQFGAIIEPFAEMTARLGMGPAPSGPGVLEARKLIAGSNGAPGGSKGRVLRQVIERREWKGEASAGTPARREIWIRSLYTNHFFDAWGEWASLKCDPANGWVVDAAIVVEVDLLKKNDFFSRLGRGKIKASTEEILHDELERWTSEIR